eukprot:1417203-Amphidinium_carterae.1
MATTIPSDAGHALHMAFLCLRVADGIESQLRPFIQGRRQFKPPRTYAREEDQLSGMPHGTCLSTDSGHATGPCIALFGAPPSSLCQVELQHASAAAFDNYFGISMVYQLECLQPLCFMTP